jgi:hypothetical protein
MSKLDQSPDKTPSVAFLIDADNLSAGGIEEAFEQLHRAQATVQVRRAYGGLEKLAGLKDVLRRHAIQSFVNQGKGTTDVALVIDAMDLLHRGGLPTTVAIGSSDADFAPLAVRLREAGKLVICFAQKVISAETLPLAYDKVIFVDTKIVSVPASTVQMPAPAPAPAPAPIPAKASATQTTSTAPISSVALPLAKMPALKQVPSATSPANASAALDGVVVVKKIIGAIPGWLPNTIKQLNQLGAPLMAAGFKKSSKPLHELFRKHPAFFKVLPTTGPAKQVRLLKLP